MDPSPEAAPEAARRSRQLAKAETREALINAGISLFSEQGFDQPSLDAICSHAGYTRGAFYVHFADREAFIVAVMDTVLRGFIDAIIASGGGALDLERSVQTFVAAATAGAFPLEGSVRLHHFLAACARSEAIRSRYVELVRGAMRRVAAAARAGQKAGTVRPDVDADQIGALLVALVLGVEVMLQTQTPFDLDAGGSSVLQLLRPHSDRS